MFSQSKMSKAFFFSILSVLFNVPISEARSYQKFSPRITRSVAKQRALQESTTKASDEPDDIIEDEISTGEIASQQSRSRQIPRLSLTAVGDVTRVDSTNESAKCTEASAPAAHAIQEKEISTMSQDTVVHSGQSTQSSLSSGSPRVEPESHSAHLFFGQGEHNSNASASTASTAEQHLDTLRKGIAHNKAKHSTPQKSGPDGQALVAKKDLPPLSVHKSSSLQRVVLKRGVSKSLLFQKRAGHLRDKKHKFFRKPFEIQEKQKN